MRRIISSLLVAIAAVACLAILSAALGWAVAAPPPLSLDGYRDEKLPTGGDASAALKEFNGNCYVCHGNYRTESLVQSHAKEKVGCVECHGESIPHQVDEFHRTPPEKMYGPHNVDAMCSKCHEGHDAPASKVVQRWRERCSSKADPEAIVCTDCHYEHRLAFRTVVWDKQTGKLVVRKGNDDVSHAKSE